MFNHKNILKDKKIINLYKNIDKENNYVVSHGLIHMKDVLKIAKSLCKSLKFSKKDKSLLLTAVVLHDTGRINKDEPHNENGRDFAIKYLKTHLTEEEIQKIANAIYYHSSESVDVSKMDKIAFALILSDKLDFLKKRLIRSLMHQAVGEKFNLYKHTKNIKVTLKNNKLIIKIISDSVNMPEYFAKYKHATTGLFEAFTEFFKLDDYQFIFSK